MMMLLIGMWINLTKKPMKPIMRNPTPVAVKMRWNSFLSGLVHFFTRWILQQDRLSQLQTEITMLTILCRKWCNSNLFLAKVFKGMMTWVLMSAMSKRKIGRVSC